MWVKVDDRFPRHPKVLAAARHLGRNGVGRVIAVWLESLCYCAEHLTDGFLPEAIARRLMSDQRPLDVLEVLALDDVRLMRRAEGGYQVHDYEHYNPSAASVKEKRDRDRERKRSGQAADRSGIQRPSMLDSARNPERSRARDPVPVPVPATAGVEQRADARTALAGVRRHLLRAAHLELDENPAALDADVVEAVKTAAAKLGVSGRGQAVTRFVDAARAQRRRSA